MKCDEIKPACNRCLVDGVGCDYNLPSRPRRSNTTSRTSRTPGSNLIARSHAATLPTMQYSLSQTEGSPLDKHYFGMFKSTMPSIQDEPLYAQFWNQLVPQLCHTEPVVWHSIIATAAVLQELLPRPEPKEQTVEHTFYRVSIPKPLGKKSKVVDQQVAFSPSTYSLRHYQQANSLLLNSKITDAKVPLEARIVACYLFFGLEMLLGHVERAMGMLRVGYRLISAFSSKGSSLSTEILAPIFHHSISNSILYGSIIHSIPEDDEMRIPEKAAFVGVLDASSSLLQITSSALYRAQAFQNHLTSSDAPYPSAEVERQLVEYRLQSWSKKFNDLLARPYMLDKSNLQKVENIKYVTLRHKLASIWLPTRFSMHETDYDKHHKEFAEILNAMPRDNTKPLQFRPDLFSQIYMVVTKCRNPTTRHRGLEFMKTFADSGPWVNFIIRVTIRLVEIEEEGLRDRKDGSGEVVPEDWARVHDFRVTADPRCPGQEWKLVQFWQRIEGKSRPREERFIVQPRFFPPME